MAITINNLQISGTSNDQNYIEGNWTQNDSITAMNFSYLSVANSAVSGGLVGGWKAYTTNGGVDYGNNVGWVFVPDVPEPFTNTGAGFLLFFNP
jgi:uncharacterized protein YycO